MPYLPRRHGLSVEDYLAGEDGSDVRHEYIDGGLYAMTGANDRHGLIVGNIQAALRPLVRGTGCRLFATDMKVRLRHCREANLLISKHC
jgi:Uma2 family endonuclease